MIMKYDTLPTLAFQDEYTGFKTETKRILLKIEEMVHSCPEILQAVANDLDDAAKKAKHKRNLKKITFSPNLDGFVFPERTTINHIKFGIGCPRTEIIMVIAVVILGEKFGGYDSKQFEHMYENHYLIKFALKHNKGNIPCTESCRNFAKALTEETLNKIVAYTCQVAQNKRLDNFNHMIGDSTHVNANSRKPSDSELLFFTSRIILHLIENALKIYSSLLTRKEIRKINSLREIIKKKRFKHNLSKSDPTMKRKSLLQMLKNHTDIFNFSDEVYQRIEEINLPEPKWQKIKNELEMELYNLFNLIDCITANDKVDSANQPKFLSRSDKDAAWIIKGNKQPEFGYRIQILSSENGMISSVITPKGNKQDKSMLIDLIEQHRKFLPYTKNFSFDDGYTSKGNYHWSKENDLNLILKGANAAKLYGDKYDDSTLAEFRRKRSIIEGQISRLKQITTLRRVYSRGHENVKKEILRKVILANFMTIIRLENKFKISHKVA